MWENGFEELMADGARFDFVVVGGGTAGCVVAGRLAENPDVSVLVVEAGVGNPWELAETTTPSKAMDLRHGEHDWDYKAKCASPAFPETSKPGLLFVSLEGGSLSGSEQEVSGRAA